MQTTLTILLCIGLSFALKVKQPTLSVQAAKSTSDTYACSCTDPDAGTIYLFNQIYTTEQGSKQFSSQVTIDQKTLESKVTIPDMGKYFQLKNDLQVIEMFKFDQFHATTCVVSKNILYVLGHKIPDGFNVDNKTNAIVKWRLDSYELLQYNQLDSSLDSEYFYDMAVDHDMRLLFAISSKKLQQLDMNCLDILDTVHTFPFMKQDNQTTPYLTSVVVNTAAKRVFIGMQHISATNPPSGAIYAISYQKETLSKEIDTLRMGEHLQVSSLAVDSVKNTLYAGVYFISTHTTPDNSSIITLTAEKGQPKVVSIYDAKPTEGHLPYKLLFSQQDSKLYTLSEKSFKDRENYACAYSLVTATQIKLDTCIPVTIGYHLHSSYKDTALLYPYIGYDETSKLTYRLAVIEK